MPDRTAVAAVDIGTNSIRLLVGHADADGGLVVNDRRMTITRLGEGVDATGRLAEGAMHRTLDVLAGYAESWRARGIDRVRVTATSAARDAVNAAEFTDAVQRLAGVSPEVLSGMAEAELAFLGATAALPGEHPDPYAVLDIGGGSTEMVRGSDRAQAATSRQIGSVRLAERFLHHDVPTSMELSAAREVVDAELAEVAREVDPGSARTLVGTAGTVTTVAALHLDLPAYLPERIHGTVLPAAAVHDWAGRLAAMPAESRAALPPMAPGREDVVHAGALILSRVVDTFGFDHVVVSEADILDGLARSLL